MENTLNKLAEDLARNRAAGTVAELPTSILCSKEDAIAVQAAALDAYDSDFRGYALVGTNPPVRRTLGLCEPIFCAIPDRAFFENSRDMALPRGMLGAQCELVFTIGEAYPAANETIDLKSAAGVVLACRPAIGLLGRRIRAAPENDLAAIADFGFHVATVCGRSTRLIDPMELDKMMMTARIDGNIVMSGSAGTIFGHPLEAVAWLARTLSAEQRHLNADDIVATGSCAPILQVLPGQNLTVEFTGLETVSCDFE